MYIAAKGGEEAIQQSEHLYHLLNGELTIDTVRMIEKSMPYLVDRVMGEGSLYSPELAALAIAQTGGDLYEAVLLLRAYRATQPRLAYAQPIEPGEVLTVRRISAAFKDIPGGQVLGPSLDYSHRLLKLDVLDGTREPQEAFQPAEQPAPPAYPPVAGWLREQGLLAEAKADATQAADIPDVTTENVLFPAPRPHRLQAMARADTGGVLSLGYSIMRGYGLIHPTVNELRLGHAEVTLTHPVTGEKFSAGRVRVSQCEVVSPGGDEKGYAIGFAATLGWNEVKLIAASTLDLDMASQDGDGAKHPAHEEEFVMYHTEPVESSGFCIHFKLPHYVTFASGLDNIRKVIQATYG